MSTRGSETIIRHRRGREVMGNPAEDEDPVSYTGCAVYPRGIDSEQSGRAATVLDGYTILIPPQPDGSDVDIVSTDEIEWSRKPGQRASVVGDVGIWPYLDGQRAGFQVNVRYAHG